MIDHIQLIDHAFTSVAFRLILILPIVWADRDVYAIIDDVDPIEGVQDALVLLRDHGMPAHVVIWDEPDSRWETRVDVEVALQICYAVPILVRLAPLDVPGISVPSEILLEFLRQIVCTVEE